MRAEPAADGGTHIVMVLVWLFMVVETSSLQRAMLPIVVVAAKPGPLQLPTTPARTVS